MQGILSLLDLFLHLLVNLLHSPFRSALFHDLFPRMHEVIIKRIQEGHACWFILTMIDVFPLCELYSCLTVTAQYILLWKGNTNMFLLITLLEKNLLLCLEVALFLQHTALQDENTIPLFHLPSLYFYDCVLIKDWVFFFKAFISETRATGPSSRRLHWCGWGV